MIESFRGDYEWLSNFSCLGGCFLTAEHHYQAAKATSVKDAIYVMSASEPRIAKRRGRKIVCRDDWDSIKVDEMHAILRLKFSIEPIQTMLINTGDVELVEGNWWGDTFWGVCNGRGDNVLGELLMCVRDEIRGNR